MKTEPSSNHNQEQQSSTNNQQQNKQKIRDEDLFREYERTKDINVRNKIIERNYPLVTHIVNKYFSSKELYKQKREDLIQEGIMGLMNAIEGFRVDYGYRFSTYSCVPTSTQILTKRGWKYYSELIENQDETLGYDFKTGKTKWTTIKNVSTYKNAPLMEFGNSCWSVLCTHDHKWLFHNNGKAELKPLSVWPNSKKFQFPEYSPSTKKYQRPDVHLITSAPFEGGNSNITPNEASILAWVLSDGHIYNSPKTNINPSKATIIQSKNKFADEIRNLLEEESAITSASRKDNNCLAFNVKISRFREIWQKANLDEKSLFDFVLELKPESRKAWFDTWYKAEGAMNANCITQNKGDKLEALQLAAYLEGYYGVHYRFKPCGKNEKHFSVRWYSDKNTPRTCLVKPSDQIRDVWCPTTELGTWTARDENGRVFLTGNSHWVKQAIYNYISNIDPMIHIPSHVRTAHNKLIKKLNEYGADLGDVINPDNKDINVDDLGLPLSEKMVNSINNAVQSKNITSIDTPMSSNDGNGNNNESETENASYRELIPNTEDEASQEERADYDALTKIFTKALKSLNKRERNILLLRFNIIDSNQIE